MRQPEHCDKPIVLSLVAQRDGHKPACEGHARAANRPDYLARIISFFKKSSPLRRRRDDAAASARIITFSDLKRREQRVEWRRRQAYYRRHGRSPGLTLIKLDGAPRRPGN